MIAEAVDAALLLWRALWWWLLAGAVVVTVGGLVAVAGVWWVCASLRARIARRGPRWGLGAPQTHSRDSRATEGAPEALTEALSDSPLQNRPNRSKA